MKFAQVLLSFINFKWHWDFFVFACVCECACVHCRDWSYDAGCGQRCWKSGAAVLPPPSLCLLFWNSWSLSSSGGTRSGFPFRHTHAHKHIRADTHSLSGAQQKHTQHSLLAGKLCTNVILEFSSSALCKLQKVCCEKYSPVFLLFLPGVMFLVHALPLPWLVIKGHLGHAVVSTGTSHRG